jgi:NADH dehydrogenase [ubiquinone] 1 alpha subcomplex assembly factor 5
MLDSSERMLLRDERAWRGAAGGVEAHAVRAPLEGAPLPFADASFDLVLSSMALHWVNDLPGVFAEALRVLRPDGCLLMVLPGGETLQELRASFFAAESAADGGVSPRASPMVAVADAGNLLTAAGFALCTVDADTFTIEYPSAAALFRHLRAMGESNAALGARGGARPALLRAAGAHYEREFPGEDGAGVSATVQLIFAIGWKPAPTQPQPRARGSVPKGFGERKAVAAGCA